MSRRTIDRTPTPYRVECAYNVLQSNGAIASTHRCEGQCLTDARPGEIEWSEVTRNDVPQTFMEGLRYRRDDSPMGTDLFRRFPSTAFECRYLVWDMRLMEHYAEGFQGRLVLNEPLRIERESAWPFAAVEASDSTRADLTWLANTDFRGHPCGLVRYRSFFNRLNTEVGPMQFRGATQYWGEIWVSLNSRRLEYATLYECTTVLLGKTTPMIVMREGTFKRLEQ